MFKVGDTVRLKSGGPLMTISEIGSWDYSSEGSQNNEAMCVWFVGNKKNDAVFKLEILVIAES